MRNYCSNCSSSLIMLLFSREIFYCCSFCYSQFLYTYACAEKFSASAQMLPQGLRGTPLAPKAVFSKQGTKAFSSAEYAAKPSSFSEILPLHIPESQCESLIPISCIRSFHMHEHLVYLYNPDSDHDSPQRCIQRSIILVKPPCAAPDPNPDIPEFLVKLNPKLSDPDASTKN